MNNMINVDLDNLSYFREYEKNYIHLKDNTKKWIEANYQPATSVYKEVYLLVNELELPVGYLLSYVLCIWLNEWGYKIKAVNNGYYCIVVLVKRLRNKSKG